MKTKQLKSGTFTSKVYTVLFVASLLFTSLAVSAQVKIGTSPTVIGPNSNLEVEAANNKKVIVNKVDGTVIIENVPLGTGMEKPMTIDAAGNVRQGAFPVQAVPEIVWVGTLTSDYSTPVVGTTAYTTLPTLLPLTPSPKSSVGGWNATTKSFTFQQAGYYRIVAGATVWGSAPSPQTAGAYVRLTTPNGGVALTVEPQVSSNLGRISYPAIWEGYYNVGDVISFGVQFYATSGQSTLIVKANQTFMSIMKIPF